MTRAGLRKEMERKGLDAYPITLACPDCGRETLTELRRISTIAFGENCVQRFFPPHGSCNGGPV